MISDCVNWDSFLSDLPLLWVSFLPVLVNIPQVKLSTALALHTVFHVVVSMTKFLELFPERVPLCQISALEMCHLFALS